MKKISDFDFRYSGRMSGAMQSLPIGSGVMGANVWLGEDGGLRLLISRTDAWSELARLLKTAEIAIYGGIRGVAGGKAGADFRLDIENGVLYISGGFGRYTVYAQDGEPVIRVKAELSAPAGIRAEILNYRCEPIKPTDNSNCATLADISESADVVRPVAGGLAQIHRNAESCYESMLERQQMESFIGRRRDPLLGWTFGTAVFSPELKPDGTALISDGDISSFTLTVVSDAGFTGSAGEMADRLAAMYDRYGPWSGGKLEESSESWRSFWKRSYILASGSEEAESVTRGLLYQRYMVRCADRGAMPIKFNGSIFVVSETPGREGNYDARRWGGPYWIQNTRLIYWYLLKMGDYGSMTPLIDMYLDMIPVCEARCRGYYGHSGIHVWETSTFFGLARDEDYGAHGEGTQSRRGEMTNRYIRWHFEGMLELSYMMLRYLTLSGDEERRQGIFDFCLKTLQFFHGHFGTHAGKLLICPASAIETWQFCADDAPDVAGLTAVCRYLADMPDVPGELRSFAEKMSDIIPPVPSDGEKLLPCAAKIENVTRNSENPELYPVFPFDLYGLGKPDIKLALNAYDSRVFRHDGGWSQDPIDAALLGLVDETKRHMVRECSMKDKDALFPAMWGPNFDETPDQDHGSVICITAASMLVQGETVFPCWPKEWDVEFRLPDGLGGYVTGRQHDGEREYSVEK